MQVPKTTMEDYEVEHKHYKIETETRTIQVPKQVMEDQEIQVQVPTRRKVPIQKMVPRTVLVPVTVHVEQVHMETESRTIQVLPPALSLNPRSSRAAHNPPPPACVGCCGLALESVSGPARPDAETVRGRNLQIKGQGGWRAGGWGRCVWEALAVVRQDAVLSPSLPFCP